MICPICKTEFDEKTNKKYFPFDREQCKLVDLYKWLVSEEYFIPEGDKINDEDDEGY